MNFFRTVRGPYACFKPIGEINASMLVHFKSAVSNDLVEGRYDIAIDCKKTMGIDATGMRFLLNLNNTLRKIRRKLVFFECNPELVDRLYKENPEWELYLTLSNFERSFHEINSALVKNFFELAAGTGQIRTLELICPICGQERIKGFVDLETEYELQWTENSITPEYSFAQDLENEIDPERYRVAVCQNCLFATNRLDWYDVRLPEGVLESRLTEDEIERISNRMQQRKSLRLENPIIDQTHFFGIPRETRAAYLAWNLNEMTYRDIARDKGLIDAFQIAFCHFMMCKYTDDMEKIESHVDTALAWLVGLMQKKERYASYRILQGMVYLISIYLSKNKLGDALKVERQMLQSFSKQGENEFWILRALELIQDEKIQMESQGYEDD